MLAIPRLWKWSWSGTSKSYYREGQEEGFLLVGEMERFLEYFLFNVSVWGSSFITQNSPNCIKVNHLEGLQREGIADCCSAWFRMEICKCTTTSRSIIHSLTGSVPSPSNAHRQMRWMKHGALYTIKKRSEDFIELPICSCHTSAISWTATQALWVQPFEVMQMQVYNWTFSRRGVLMTDWEYFWPRLPSSGIHFSIAQVRAASAQTRRETRISCRQGAALTAAPSPCPVLVPSHHTLIHFPLITSRRSPSFLFHLDPPLEFWPFPPLHLPPSTSLSTSPLFPSLSISIYFESHAGPVPQNLKPCASSLVGRRRGVEQGRTEGTLSGYRCLNGNGSPGGLKAIYAPVSQININ